MALKWIARAGYGRMEPLLYQPEPLRHITPLRKGDAYQSKVICRSIVGLFMVSLDSVDEKRLHIEQFVASSYPQLHLHYFRFKERTNSLSGDMCLSTTFHDARPGSG